MAVQGDHNKITMKIYHGSNTAVIEPIISKGKFPKDFGTGFYCTKFKRQATRWALRKDNPTITSYDFILNKDLSIKVFETMTDEWLDFIVSCRSGIEHVFDIVTGPMANDQVYNFVEDFSKGLITRKQFWALAEFKYPTHQICFATPEALKCITYLNHTQIRKK